MKTKAIILKKQNTNEYDQLVTCYTYELGKIAAIAKSILKKNSIQSMHLDCLNLVDFELINGNHMPIITGAQVERSYLGLKHSLSAMSAAFVIAEYTDKVTFEYMQDRDLWNFLLNILHSLDSSPGNWNRLLRKAELQLLGIMGYYPNLDGCSVCLIKSDKYVAFNTELGGVICGECFLKGARGVILKEDDLRVLKGLDVDFKSSRSVLDALLEHTVGGKLNSLDFFYRLNSMIK